MASPLLSYESPLLVVLGPTASGKSALALRLAEASGGEIVCADSTQVYRGMDAGTAKASPADRERVPHHALDLVEPDQPMNAARWVEAAEAAIAGIRARGRQPIIEGGTFLYVRALLEGLFEAPPADAAIRARHVERAEREGREALHAELERVDAVAAGRIASGDLVRVSRALELFEQTGVPLSEHWARAARGRRHPARPVVLLPPRERLDAAIADRVRSIFPPLVAEVATLRARGYGPGLPSQRALGYAEAELVGRGALSMADGILRLERATRRYAKRQRTWLRALRSPAGDPPPALFASSDEAFAALALPAASGSPMRQGAAP